MNRFVVVLALVAALALSVPKRAEALWPLWLAPGAGLVFDSGTMAASYASAIALVGGIVAWVSFGEPNPEAALSDTPAPSALQVRIKPDVSPVTPSGWTAGTAGGDPVPPSVRGRSNSGAGGGVAFWTSTGPQNDPMLACLGQREEHGFSSIQLAAAGLVDALNNDPQCAADDWATCGAANNGVEKNGDGACNDIDFVRFETIATCPKGYTADAGGTCTLSVPASDIPYPNDGGCGIKKANGTWLKDLRDPDCNASNLTVTGRRATVNNGSDKTYLDSQVDGSTTITEVKGNGDGNSTVTQYNIGSDFALNNGSQNVVPGFGGDTGAPPNPGTNPDTQCGGSGQPPCGTGSCGGDGQPPCKIDDSGFNGKDAKANDAVLAHGTFADGVSGRITDAKTAPSYSGTWLPSLMPGTFSSCRPITWHVGISHGLMSGYSSDHSYDFCTIFAKVQQILGWLAFAFTALYIVKQFFRSNKGES